MELRLPPDEEALLVEMKRAWGDDFKFFSNAGKGERERWVAREFLERLGLSFSADELLSPPQASNVDVAFRAACFQVKEIADPSFRRGADIKATYRRVMAARTLQETVGPGFAYDVPSPARAYELARNMALELGASSKYCAAREKLDLLFYVTRTRTSRISTKDLQRRELAVSRWRSISCLIGQQATVLHAADDAPGFLQAAAP